MKRLLFFCAILAGIGWSLPTYAAVSTVTQSAVAVDGNGTAVTVYDTGSVGINIAITGKASVNFEGSIDGGTTYGAIICRRGGSTSGDVSTTNASGLYFCSSAGMTNVRTPVIGWQTGTVTVTVNVTQMTLNTLLSGEDETNNALMVEGAAVRGTEGNIINSAVGDATSAAFQLPTGWKTITGRITGAGAVVQTIKIYGGTSSSMAAVTSDELCSISLSGTSGGAGTALSCAPFTGAHLYYLVVTSASSGTPTTILTAAY